MIGVFDSGVGGLSVLREIHKQIPNQPTIYFADQKNVPYGPRSAKEVQAFSHSVCDYLVSRGAKVIVVACNTATAAAINWLRETYPAEISFVGMEPAIKPAATITKTGRIGVMATAGTFKSQRYAALMTRFAKDVQLFENSCVGLVEQIESGDLDSADTYELLTSFINPMLEEGIDALILGCTHYPFVLPAIKSIVGDSVTVIDPAPAVARQTARLIQSDKNDAANRPVVREYSTSGNFIEFISSVNRLQNISENKTKVGQNRFISIAKNSHLNFYQKVHNN